MGCGGIGKRKVDCRLLNRPDDSIFLHNYRVQIPISPLQINCEQGTCV